MYFLRSLERLVTWKVLHTEHTALTTSDRQRSFTFEVFWGGYFSIVLKRRITDRRRSIEWCFERGDRQVYGRTYLNHFLDRVYIELVDRSIINMHICVATARNRRSSLIFINIYIIFPCFLLHVSSDSLVEYVICIKHIHNSKM